MRHKQSKSYLVDILSITIGLLCIYKCDGFNISPMPNIILRDPTTSTNKTNSYFGFSLNLRRNRYGNCEYNLCSSYFQIKIVCTKQHQWQTIFFFTLTNKLRLYNYICFDSVLIGAPRAQSIDSADLDAPGMVYKCNLDKSTSANCKPFLYDKIGNENGRFIKSGQWLGMTMDGGAYDNESFVVNEI